MMRWAALILIGLSSWGCREGAKDWKSQSEAIQGGQLDSDDRAAVGIVVHLATQQITCSGALIAPAVVATARHCVAAASTGPVACGQSPIGDTYPVSAIDVTTTLTSDNSLPSDAGAHHSVKEIRVAPGGDDACGFDLALLVLSDVVTAEEATPFVPRFEPALRDEESYAAIGYGATCGDLINNERCRIESGTRRRIDNLSVQCADSCADADVAPAGEWLGERGLCEGDSGGPALDEHGVLIGVGLRGAVDETGNCIGAVFAGVTPWQAFFAGAVRDGAAQVGGAIPPWAIEDHDASLLSEESTADAVDSEPGTSDAKVDERPLDADRDQQKDAECGQSCVDAENFPTGHLVAAGGCQVAASPSSAFAWVMSALFFAGGARSNRSKAHRRSFRARHS